MCELLAGAARVVFPELPQAGPPLAGGWVRGLAEVFGGGEALVLADRSAEADAAPLVGLPGLLVSLIDEA